MKKLTSLFYSLLSSKVVRSSIITMTGTVGTNFLAYLYHLLVGRILGPEQYGELAALLSIFYIINVPSGVLQTVLTKYFSVLKARDDKSKAKGLFIKATKLMAISAGVGFIVLIPFTGILSNFLHLSSPVYFIWLYLIFASFLISVVQLGALQGFQLFFQTSIFTNIGMILRLTFGVAGAFLGVGATLVSSLLSNFVMYFVTFIPLRPILRAKTSEYHFEKVKTIGYSVPTLFTMLGMTALFSQDVILVKHFFTATDAGMYSALSVLGKVIFYASSAFGFVLFPIVAERKERKERHTHIVWYSLMVIGGISFVLSCIYFFFPKMVIDLFWGKSFYAAAPYLGLFGVFISFFSLSSLLINVCLASDKTKAWIPAIFATVSQLLLVWFYHDTLLSVIYINLGVSISLFLALLVYYSYDKSLS